MGRFYTYPTDSLKTNDLIPYKSFRKHLQLELDSVLQFVAVSFRKVERSAIIVEEPENYRLNKNARKGLLDSR
jgi:hypothetical protein